MLITLLISFIVDSKSHRFLHLFPLNTIGMCKTDLDERDRERNNQIHMSVIMQSSLKHIISFSLLHFHCFEKSFQFSEFRLFFFNLKCNEQKKQSHRLIMFALMMLIIILEYVLFFYIWVKYIRNESMSTYELCIVHNLWPQFNVCRILFDFLF